MLPDPLSLSPEGPEQDIRLLALAGQRNSEALSLLHEAHGPAAFRLAYRVLGSHAPAEDVVRKVFVAVSRGEARERARGENVRDWLLSQVRAEAVAALCHA